MAAQLHFHLRREPAQFVACAIAYEECRFGEVVLSRDGLHLGIGEPVFKRADGGGIAGEDAPGKSIHLVHRNA